jgi:hypothetical protein
MKVSSLRRLPRLDCRQVYPMQQQLDEGLLPVVGNRRFFCSDRCRQQHTVRSDSGELRRIGTSPSAITSCLLVSTSSHCVSTREQSVALPSH